MAAIATLSVTSLSTGAASMGSISFFSSCPACKQARLQNGYTRAELTVALRAGHALDAYCLMCDVVWSIGARERFLMARLLAAHQPATPQFPSDKARHARASEC